MNPTFARVAIGLILLLAGAPVHAAPQRVISTHLCADEFVFRLVPRNRIVALSYLAGDTHPIVSTIADKVNGIDLIRGSAEEVLTRNPDLVVLYEGTNPRLKDHLIEAHVKFIEIPWSDSLRDVRAETLKLGSFLDNVGGAEALVRNMDRDLANAHRSAAKLGVPTLIYEPNGYATGGTFTDEIMAAAGLRNAASDLSPTRSGTIPVEMVVAEAPKLLIINGSQGARSKADLVLEHPGLAALAGRIRVTHAALTPLLCPGPWSAGIAPLLSEWGRAASQQTRRAGNS